MSYFYNADMAAPNVLTFAVDPTIAEEFADDFLGSVPLDVTRPAWSSDISWHSPADEEGFAIFQSAFDRLGIADHAAPYLDLEREVRMYAGFLITRSRCDRVDFHLDWKGTGNQAFNIIIPVSGDFETFGLLYRNLTVDRNSEGATEMGIAEYRYKRGEAIMIGDQFYHSTKPGRSASPVRLLSFTLGTDRMEYWDRIKRTAGYQAPLMRLPDGTLVRTS